MTDEQLHAGRIEVEDLGEPSDLPPELAAELDAEDAGPEPADDPARDRRRAGVASKLITALFRVSGVLGGWGLPAGARTAVRMVWEADALETAQIGAALAPLVPDRWIQSRAVGALGLAGGLVALAQSIADRTADTARIRKEAAHDHIHPAGAEPANDAGAGRAGPRSGGGRVAPAVEPGAERTPEPVDGFSGAGLGLGEGE